MKNIRPLFLLYLSLMMLASTNFIPQIGRLNQDNFIGTPDDGIFDNTVWWIKKSVGPQLQSSMSIFIDGVDKGTTYLLEFGHRDGDEWPEIATIYNTGYIRMAPSGEPYGTSFVLGPAYWDSNGEYIHTIQISRIDIDTSSAVPSGPLHLTIQARDYSESRWPNYRLTITYEIELPDPSVDSTQMDVTETFSVASAFSLLAARQITHEGFKWVQFSSMYLNDIQHDSDSVLYVDSNEEIQYSEFSTDSGCNYSIFTLPLPFSASNPWAEVRHNDDMGVNGNTPNTIIIVNSTDLISHITPQGYLSCILDSNDNNVGLWLNNDAAPTSFNIGDMGSINFTLVAQDDPKEPPPFIDVPVNSWARQHILRLAAAAITSGCAPEKYCPESLVTRAQMAVFLERGMHHPAAFSPPNVTSTFTDTVDHWAEDWIEALKNDGITSGCGTGLYCPEYPVTRDQMAVFLLRSKYGSSYGPPAVGASTGFGDVPTNHWAAAWIKQLVVEGITSGCGGGNYCPEKPVTRAQMAVFLVKTFNLP